MKLQGVLDEIKDRMNAALDGEVNELIAFQELYLIEAAAADAKEKVKFGALETLENRYNGKAEDNGAIFEKTQSGRYDYSQIPEWTAAKETLTKIEKQAQQAYKTAVNGTMMVDSDGCVIAAASYKPNTPSIKITFKK